MLQFRNGDIHVSKQLIYHQVNRVARTHICIQEGRNGIRLYYLHIECGYVEEIYEGDSCKSRHRVLPRPERPQLIRNGDLLAQTACEVFFPLVLVYWTQSLTVNADGINDTAQVKVPSKRFSFADYLFVADFLLHVAVFLHISNAYLFSKMESFDMFLHCIDRNQIYTVHYSVSWLSFSDFAIAETWVIVI